MKNYSYSSLILLIIICSSLFTINYCSLVIRSPKELSKQFINETIATGLSTFGRIPYGHTIEGRLYFDPNETMNQHGCDPFTRITKDDPLVGESPFILVKKGDCSFTKQTKNIEEAGGHVAIIINDQPLTPENMYMTDDGNGGDISIPAVLISKEDGDKLIAFYNSIKSKKDELKKLRMEIIFEIEKRDNTVKYDLWYRPDEEEVYQFLKSFRKYHNELGKTANLGVHYVMYIDYSYNREMNQLLPNCLGSGLYCAKEQPGKGINEGYLIVEQMLYQKCVYNYAYNYDITNKSNERKYFFDYMEQFYKKCFKKERFNSECSKEILDKLKIKQNIEMCIDFSYDNSDPKKKEKNYMRFMNTKLLDADYESRKKYYINKDPSMTINGRVFNKGLRAELIFESACAALFDKPKSCFNEANFSSNSGFSFLTAFLVVLLVLGLNIVIFYFCKKFIRKNIEQRIEGTDINARIDTVVNSYLALREQKTEK